MSCSDFFQACKTYLTVNPTWMEKIRKSQNWLHHYQCVSRDIIHPTVKYKNKEGSPYSNKKIPVQDREMQAVQNIPLQRYTLLERECIEELIEKLSDDFVYLCRTQCLSGM